MIEIVLKSRRVAPVYSPTYTPTYLPPPTTPAIKTIMDEAMRRDQIIQKLVAACPYGQGEIVQPVSPEKQAEHGNNIVVKTIYTSYTAYGRTQPWPANDNPCIVACFSELTKQHFDCTTNFLEVKPA